MVDKLPFRQLVSLPDFWTINSNELFVSPIYGTYNLLL